MKELNRITINPNVCLGQPTIRGMRIKVLAGGKSIPRIQNSQKKTCFNR